MNAENITPFDHKHYLAVLRCREGEKKALMELSPTIRSKMTPLIEVPRRLSVSISNPNKPGEKMPEYLGRYDSRIPQVLDDLLQKITSDIKKVWFGKYIFLDLQHLYSEWRVKNGVHPVTACWDYAFASLFPPEAIPVVTLNSDEAFRQAIRGVLSQGVLSNRDVGIALRLTRQDLADPELVSHIETLIQFFELTPTKVDLIVDLGVVGEDENQVDLEWVCSRIPWIQSWRTYSCVSGSFPNNLSELGVGEHDLVRSEWNSYREQVANMNLLRRPTFGDYAAQHAEYSEPNGPVTVSAAIRYTADGKYVYLRGVSLKLGAKYLQYPALAASLCDRSEFGTIVSQCAGDIYIQDKANKMLEIEASGEGTGNPTTWIQASFSRHWTVAVTEISSLFES